MPKLGYLLDGPRGTATTARQERLSRRRLWKILGGLPRASRAQGNALWSQCVSTLGGWITTRLRQRRVKARLDLELLLHAQAMKEALQEAEEKVRAEIALRVQAERKAREEAEARLRIERMARRDAERKMEWLSTPARRAHPETIAKAQREMISRIKAEQRAIKKGRGIDSSNA